MARRTLAGLLGTAVIAGTSVLAAPPALAADCGLNDETAPTISNVSVSDVALTSEGGNSTVLATVTDPPTTYDGVPCASGVAFVFVSMYAPTDGFEEQDLTLVSGDEISGRWSATIPFHAESETGTWEVFLSAEDNEFGFVEEQGFGTFTVSTATTRRPNPTPAPGGAALPLGGVRIMRVTYDIPGAGKGSNRSLRAEWVRLTNNAKTTRDLYGATIRDRIGHVYTFTGHHRLSPGENVTVHTGPGADTSRHLFWDADGYVWNNDRDRAVLRNAAGKTVDYCTWSSPRRDVKLC
jgi:hypothetical protein